MAVSGHAAEMQFGRVLLQPAVRVVGDAPHTVVHGVSRGEYFINVLQTIIPKDFQLESDGVGMEFAAEVTWRGGKSWIEILADVLDQVPGVSAVIDATEHRVFLKANGEYSAVRPTHSLKIAAGKPVALVLADFFRGEGWEFVWRAPLDWTLDQDVALEGTPSDLASQVVAMLQERGRKVVISAWDSQRIIEIRGLNDN